MLLLVLIASWAVIAAIGALVIVGAARLAHAADMAAGSHDARVIRTTRHPA